MGDKSGERVSHLNTSIPLSANALRESVRPSIFFVIVLRLLSGNGLLLNGVGKRKTGGWCQSVGGFFLPQQLHSAPRRSGRLKKNGQRIEPGATGLESEPY